MEKNTKTTNTREWAPNEKQKLFMKVVKENPNRTLKDISKIAGVEFKSGTINTLVAHGLIDNTEKVKVEVITHKEVSTYKLVD